MSCVYAPFQQVFPASTALWSPETQTHATPTLNKAPETSAPASRLIDSVWDLRGWVTL